MASAPSRWSNPTTACSRWACSPRAAAPAFSSPRSEAGRRAAALALHATPSAIDALTPDLYSGVSDALPVGAGWLPPEWYGETTILDAVRHAMKIPANRLRGYGHPLGFPTLRQHMAATLAKNCSRSSPDQILLTHGATHAFDLILRTLTKPGDTVLVEDPGYSNLLSLVRHHGCIPVGIPRGEQGLDFDVLAQQAARTQPKLMFVNTVLQNPARHLAVRRRRRTACWAWPSSSTSGWWKTTSTANWPRAAKPRWRRWTGCGA